MAMAALSRRALSSVMGPSSLTARSNDTILTSKVKASFVDAKDLQAQAVKVVTERGVVYLMGRVTEREANRATDLARGVSGVQKVVKVFEMLTEAELASLERELTRHVGPVARVLVRRGRVRAQLDAQRPSGRQTCNQFGLDKQLFFITACGKGGGRSATSA